MNEEPALDPKESEKAERIAYLTAAFIRKDITGEELAELESWAGESDHNVELFEEMTNTENLARMMAVMMDVNPDKALERVNDKIAEQQRFQQRKMRRNIIVSVAAAVSVILVIFFAVGHNKKEKSGIVQSNPVQPDIPPGSNKAILTLSGGRKIILDSLNSIHTLQENGTQIQLDNQELSYRDSFVNNSSTVNYNTLSTPHGGQFKLLLPDGSKVWLNAMSFLRYPVSFSEKERIVELNGEGYFEVSKNAAKPFHVKVNGADVQVLGTHFNINAYPDERENKTTLLEGAVKITGQYKPVLLRPGDQAQWSATGGIITIKDADTIAAVGWKAGYFSFQRSDISELARQLQRWYDVKIQYSNDIKKHITATISRELPVSKVLVLLNGTGILHCTLRDKTIFIKP